MLAQQIQTPAQTGEDQASRSTFAPRAAHWAAAFSHLLQSAKTLANTYLKEERADASICIDEDHHKAVRDLFEQIENADALGLSLAGALQLAATGQAAAPLWYAQSDRFAASSLQGLIAANDWLRPGDVVYHAHTIQRHKLTDADFNAAAAPAVIGGAA